MGHYTNPASFSFLLRGQSCIDSTAHVRSQLSKCVIRVGYTIVWSGIYECNEYIPESESESENL